MACVNIQEIQEIITVTWNVEKTQALTTTRLTRIKMCSRLLFLWNVNLDKHSYILVICLSVVQLMLS